MSDILEECSEIIYWKSCAYYKYIVAQIKADCFNLSSKASSMINYKLLCYYQNDALTSNYSNLQ